MQNNGRIPLKKGCSPSLLPLRHLIIMITEWPSLELSSFNQIPIPGSTIFMIAVQPNFPFGSITGGLGLVAAFQFYQQRLKEDGTSRKRTHPHLKLTQKNSNFLEFLMLPGFSAGNTGFWIS